MTEVKTKLFAHESKASKKQTQEEVNIKDPEDKMLEDLVKEEKEKNNVSKR